MIDSSILQFKVTGEKENGYNIIKDVNSDAYYDLVQLNIVGQDGRKHVLVIEFLDKETFNMVFLDKDMQFVKTHNPGFQYNVVDRDDHA
jgi:hypothetical protein